MLVKAFRNSSSLKRHTRHLSRQDESAVVQQLESDRVWTNSSGRLVLQNFLQTLPPESQSPAHQSMESYIRWRMSQSTTTLPVEAVRTLSTLLSFPLTLGHALNTALPYKLELKQHLRVAVVGARAESSLPLLWWKELLFAFPSIQKLSIRFMGPGLRSNIALLKNNVVFHNQSELSLELDMKNDAVVLHEHAAAGSVLFQSDVFVLFNPGVGSETLGHLWTPTLQLLLDSRKPVVCTSHGKQDLQDDLDRLSKLAADENQQHLDNALEFLSKPCANPYASLSTRVHDKPVIPTDTSPKERQYLVANQYWYAFQAN
jgi:hypothetical protein